ncbi:MAG TPA: hypothetical protein VJ276_16220 [Thermoanaerobaculia bacterium]|nr:hypothetical protein [Thermoanaerobaculia bacterium]
MLRVTAAFTTLLVLLSPPAVAQATARQGEPSQDISDRQEFQSPMVIELPLHVTDPETWGAGWVRAEDHVDRFICDGVYLKDFVVSADRRRGAKLRLRYRLVLANARGGIDKLVDVKLELFRGAEVLQGLVLKDVDVEEGRVVTKDMEGEFSQATITAEPRLQIRITLKVTVND